MADYLTIADAAKALRAGETTSLELTNELLEKSRTYNPIMGAFVTITPELAREQAEAADAAFAAGEDKGPLQGIPLAIKDIIKVAKMPTTANSRILDPWWHGTGDAPVSTRLRKAGAVFLGKASTNEYANGAHDADKGYPIPKNPWNLDRSPGGSSSGTGIAVAAGLALGGLGTDTGGSVRYPAAFNGHTGLKTTFGLVPKSGVVPLGYSLDSVGPMARSAWDCAALLEAIAGYDPSDPSAIDVEVPRYTDLLDGSVDGISIGVPAPYFLDEGNTEPEIAAALRSAVAVLVGLGATATDMELPYIEQAISAQTVTMAGESYAYHRNDLTEKWYSYGNLTRMNVLKGALFSATDFAQAQRARVLWAETVAAALRDHDVLITPTVSVPATDRNVTVMPTLYTRLFSLIGLPSLAIPSGFSYDGLPLSIQIVGKPFADATVLKVADAFQRATDFHLQVPPIEKWLSTPASR